MNRLGRLVLLAILLAVGVVVAAPPSAGACPAEAGPAIAFRLADVRAALTGHVSDATACAPVSGALAPGGPTLGVARATVPPELVTPYEVVASYPHDRDAFLQGLVWHDGGFYESTGLYGESSLRRVAFPSGEVLQQVDLSRDYFGEGLALAGDRLIQLTWKSKKAFVYDRESFALLGELSYQTEGWGLTYDGASLILSDGSHRLTFRDPDTFETTRTLEVTLDGRPLRALNELEWIEGEIWSNVWQTDLIVRIDPASGQVTGVLDLAGLLPADQRSDRDDVLNGIAYDPDTGRIFVGGKRWPLLFEIRPLW